MSPRLADLRLLVPVTLATAGLALAGLALPSAIRPQPAGAATGISVERCIEVNTGDTFEVTFFVADITELLAWDVLYSFNREVIEVTGKDVRHILEALPNSNVVDVSDPVPNSTGTYRLGAADIGGTGAAESGSGILAILSLRAKKKGLSWSTIYRSDVNGDGAVDIGPTLTALGASHIGDTNGDSFFDGPITGGQIAVDRQCTYPVPTPPPPQGVAFTSPGGTPTIQTATPDVSPSEASAGGIGESASPTTGPGEPTPTPTRVALNPRSPEGGSSGPALLTWLIGLLGGSVAIGVLLSYVIYKTARGPA